MEPDPPKLDYGMTAPPARTPGATRGMFALGVFGGMAFSLVYYVMLGTNVSQQTPFAPFGAVLLKLVAGTTLLFLPRWKPVGLGLICSIPIAILIFLGLCFGLVAFN
jgi:hypothetical protein